MQLFSYITSFSVFSSLREISIYDLRQYANELWPKRTKIQRKSVGRESVEKNSKQKGIGENALLLGFVQRKN